MLVKSQGQYFILAQIWCPHFETVLVIFSYSTINMPLYQSIYGITLNIIKEKKEFLQLNTFQSVLYSPLSIGEATHDQASCKHPNCSSKVKNGTMGTSALMLCHKIKNLRTKIGEKFTYKWIGICTIKAISKTALFTPINKLSKTLRKK